MNKASENKKVECNNYRSPGQCLLNSYSHGLVYGGCRVYWADQNCNNKESENSK